MLQGVSQLDNPTPRCARVGNNDCHGALVQQPSAKGGAFHALIFERQTNAWNKLRLLV